MYIHMYIYIYIYVHIYACTYIYWRRLRRAIAAPPHKLFPHNPMENLLKFPNWSKSFFLELNLLLYNTFWFGCYNSMQFLFLAQQIWFAEAGRVQGINHFVTNHRSQIMSDFFFELYLILPLFLLLKNAPKKTSVTKMCSQASQWVPKWFPNL